MCIAMISVDDRPIGAPDRDSPGGPSVHLTELSAALVANGVDVRVFTRRTATAQPIRATEPSGVTVVHVRRWWRARNGGGRPR